MSSGKLQAYFSPRMGKLSKAAAFGVDPQKIAQEIFVLEMHNAQLAQCSPKSVFFAAWKLAKQGLVPNHSAGGPYVVPRGKSAVVDWGVAGLTSIAMRTGRYKRIWASVYHENDTFEIRRHEQPPFHHVETNDDPGETCGAYAYAELTDGSGQIVRMRKAEVDEHRKLFAGGGDAWKTSYWAMAKKTVLKKLLRSLHCEQHDPVNEAIKQDIADDLDGSFAVEIEE